MGACVTYHSDSVPDWNSKKFDPDSFVFGSNSDVYPTYSIQRISFRQRFYGRTISVGEHPATTANRATRIMVQLPGFGANFSINGIRMLG